uniref:UBIQUITIN_CONJUGAT_2 domain-containing protein n=1 Tax=Parastrongyloides trichosuri TaxID=131310 RepID=A0A0N4Z6H9_PARTI
MSTQMRRRLMMDYKNIKKDPPPGIEARPNPENISEWDCIILGPIGTIFEDGVYRLKMEFKDEYPINPPVLRFVTKMFHPNIYTNGDICLDILQKRWLPSYTITSILTSLQSLLDDPNCDSPANAEAAELFQKNRPEYNKRVHEVVMNSLLFSGKLSKKQERKLEHIDRTKVPYLDDLNVSDVENDLLSDEEDEIKTSSESTTSSSTDSSTETSSSSSEPMDEK